AQSRYFHVVLFVSSQVMEADFLWQARLSATSHEPLTVFSMADLSQRELIGGAVAIQPSDGLPKPWQTCLICHHKSLFAGLENTHGHHDAGFRPGGPGSP